MTDADTIIDFVELVSRNAETAAAVRGAGDFPVANWLHRFSTFGEIRSVLDPLIFAGFDVPQAAGRAVLYSRLTTLLQGILFKVAGGVAMPTTRVRDLVAEIGLTFAAASAPVALDKAIWTSLISIVTFFMPARADATPLLPFLSDTLLLDYDPKSGSFKPTAEHAALDELTLAIVAFNTAMHAFKFVDFVRGKNANWPPVMVEGVSVAGVLHIMLRWATMAELALALARAMDGQGFVQPEPMPRGPFVDQEDDLQGDALSLDAVRAFVEGAR